jgi:hypothetical protein
MPATVTTQPHTTRTLTRHPQRPWRQVEFQPAPHRPLVEHHFAAPLVRELPPRREVRAAALATW